VVSVTEVPPMRIVGWVIEVSGAHEGINLRFTHGLWSNEVRAKGAAEIWNRGFIRAGKALSARVAPLYGKGAADRDGTWETVKAAWARAKSTASQVRHTTHVEKESP
jgi:hypothetical protein